MTTEENAFSQHAQRMLDGLRKLPGYVEDVARYLILVARYKEDGSAECEYGGIVLHARATSTVTEVRGQFDGAMLKRLWDDKDRRQQIAERIRIGPRPMRALFGPGGTLAPANESY